MTAYMIEGVFPILDWMELSAAFRADDYSDFGNDFSPFGYFNIAIPGYEQLRLRAFGVKASVLPTCRICTARLHSRRLAVPTSGAVSKTTRALAQADSLIPTSALTQPRRRRV